MAQQDDFERLYDGCLKLPMMKAITRFVLAQRRWAPEWSWLTTNLEKCQQHHLHHEFLSDFVHITERLCEEYDATLGPRISLEGGPNTPLDTFVLAFDFDEGCDKGDLHLPECFEWDGSALARAARAYQRECGWDFVPGAAGIWVVCCTLTSAFCGSDSGTYNGNVIGFAVLHDRDNDGEYESLAHLWTAKGIRRKGVGKRLVEEARRMYPLKHVEGPVTSDGKALLTATWPK